MKEKIKKYIIYGIVGIVGIGGVYYVHTLAKNSDIKPKTGMNNNDGESSSLFVPENIKANLPIISNKNNQNISEASVEKMNIPINVSSNLPLISTAAGSNTIVASVKALDLPNINVKYRPIAPVKINNENFLSPLIDKLARQPKIPGLNNPGLNQPTVISY